MNPDWGQIVLLCCFIPSLVLVVIGVVIIWNLARFLNKLPQLTAPDTKGLQEQYQKLKAARPNDSQQQLVRHMINRHALRQGVVGALTSVGGFLELPIGLVIDLAYSARSNAALSYFIAQAYGISDSDQALNIVQLMVLRKGRLSVDDIVMWQEQFAGAAYQRMIRFILEKTVAKLIPGIGALIGFAVNWSSVQLFGRLANEYYAGNLGKLRGHDADFG